MPFIRDKETGGVKDSERNAELVIVRGYRSGDKDWKINWNGDVFGFTAKDTTQYGGKTGNIAVSIEWFIASMDIPDKLKEKRADIMTMIKEAMEVEGMGVGFDGRPSTVVFDSRLIR